MLTDIYIIAGTAAVLTLLIAWLVVFVVFSIRKMKTVRTLGKKLKYRGTLETLTAGKGSDDD